MSAEPATASNLTAIAERLPRPAGPHRTVVHILEHGAGGPVFEVLAWGGAEEWPEEPANRDAIYVVISGEGALRRGGEVLECAVGDVLFATAGAQRHFERLSRSFSTWRILLGPSATTDGTGGPGG